VSTLLKIKVTNGLFKAMPSKTIWVYFYSNNQKKNKEEHFSTIKNIVHRKDSMDVKGSSWIYKFYECR